MGLLLSILILTPIFVALSILFIPFHIMLNIKTGPTHQLDIEFTCLKKIIRLRFAALKKELTIHLFNRKILKKKITEEKKIKKKEHKPKKSKISIPSVPTKDMIPSILQLIKGTIKTLRIEYITLKMNIGFSNPAITGIMTGHYLALKGIITDQPKITKKIDITLTPYFNKEIYNIEGKIRIKNQLKNLLPPLARFITSRPVKRIIKNKIFR